MVVTWLPDGSGVLFTGIELTDDNREQLSRSAPESDDYDPSVPSPIDDLFAIDVDGSNVRLLVEDTGSAVAVGPIPRR